jgi:hypothetical protein
MHLIKSNIGNIRSNSGQMKHTVQAHPLQQHP